MITQAHPEPRIRLRAMTSQPGKLPYGFAGNLPSEEANAVVYLLRQSAQISYSSHRLGDRLDEDSQLDSACWQTREDWSGHAAGRVGTSRFTSPDGPGDARSGPRGGRRNGKCHNRHEQQLCCRQRAIRPPPACRRPSLGRLSVHQDGATRCGAVLGVPPLLKLMHSNFRADRTREGARPAGFRQFRRYALPLPLPFLWPLAARGVGAGGAAPAGPVGAMGLTGLLRFTVFFGAV